MPLPAVCRSRRTRNGEAVPGPAATVPRPLSFKWVPGVIFARFNEDFTLALSFELLSDV